MSTLSRDPTATVASQPDIKLGSSELYTIAWITAKAIERAAATALLDEKHDEPDGFTQHVVDNNSYTWGRTGKHNVVIASLDAGADGTIAAATTMSDLISSLPHIRFGLLVGIGGGIAKPNEDQDIRLGDIVVSQPDETTGGVVQYDYGKAKADGIWEQKGSLSKPPSVLRRALGNLQARHESMPSKIPDLLERLWNANNRFMTKGRRDYTHPGISNDRLYKSEYSHVGGGVTCSECDTAWEVEREERESADPEIHYGIIASGDSLIKDSATRDKLWERQRFLCVEMEAAGLMDKFPCLVIRGISDYADSHKNDRWQRYAAATAAAFAVELLDCVPVKHVQATPKVSDVVKFTYEVVKSTDGKIDNLSTTAQSIDLKLVLDRLPYAKGARFDSQAQEHKPKCLTNTRVDLLRDLSNWVEDDTSKPILWLNGMAGTGKSTIARTFAKARAKCRDLKASFFFQRGEADRQNLTKFVPSIARQLARTVPGYAQSIKETMDADPDIASKAVAIQFAELVEALLGELREAPLLIVIDALDECEGDEHVRSLINILSRVTSNQQHLRILITSRPDLPIRLGFNDTKGNYRALILHDMPVDTIRHDITTFLIDELARIRHDFNSDVPEELELPTDWPGTDNISKLTEMAIPLFIFAATVCRFVSDNRVGSPSEQLSKYFQLSNRNFGTHLGNLYGPVLLSTVTGVSEEDRRQIVEHTRLIVGSIVTLASPLSITALSELLELRVSVTHGRLNLLHSILNIPESLRLPVRLLHTSLRDYLTDPGQKQKNEFHVDEKRVHLGLFKNSLRVMDAGLKEDICNLVWPGTQRTGIPSEQLNSCIGEELKYSCRYWVYHFQKINSPLLQLEEVFAFLQKHLFHWLEAMSLIGKLKEGSHAIRLLQTFTKSEQNEAYGQLLREIPLFLQMNSTIIDQHPLQLYSSVMCSIPTGGILDQMCRKTLPSWVQHVSEPSKMANQAQCILEGHQTPVRYCHFSLDNSLLVSCSTYGSEMHIWDLDFGECVRVMPDSGGTYRGPFKLSYDGLWIAVTTSKNNTGSESDNRAPNDESDEETVDTGSQAESYIRSGEEGSTYSSDEEEEEGDGVRLNLWLLDTNEHIGPIPLQGDIHMQPFQFSPDSKLLALVKETGSAVVLRLDTTELPSETPLIHCRQITGAASFRHYCRSGWRSYHLASPYRIEFSPDSSVLAIISHVTAPLVKEIFNPRFGYDKSAAVAVTRDGSIMVAGAFDQNFEIREYLTAGNEYRKYQIRWLESEIVICTLHCEESFVTDAQFSPNQAVLACTYGNGSVRTWKVETGECLTLFRSGPSWTQTISVWANEAIEEDREESDPIESVVLSSNRTLAATASYTGVVRVFDMGTFDCIHQFEDGFPVRTIFQYEHPELFQFSGDSKHLFAYQITSRGGGYGDTAPYLGGQFQVWDMNSGQRIISSRTRIHSTDSIGNCKGSAVSVAPDFRSIVSIRDKNVTIISVDTFSVTRELALPGDVHDVAFSPDSKSVILLASETSEIVSPGTNYQREELLLSKLNIAHAGHVVEIWPPVGTQRVLVVSSDAKFLVLEISDGRALVILTDTGELLYEFTLRHWAAQVSLIDNESVLLVYDFNVLTFRDFTNGRIIRQLRINLGSYPRRLSFDVNNQQIHTNLGTITAREDLSDKFCNIFMDEHLTGYGISSDRSWILWKGKKIFWLRPALRPWHDSIQVCGSTIVIGAEAGDVLLFKFDELNLLE
ncbi:hypothetical protein FPANT_9366 [Fusarium pseudoanthophilum]|uniref:NACHT domain-containing protein n=1 Tax=Fusarium pseudoanthophilum TaxID=48495 RepID=A0A8H5KTR6_9HYPO|nr:hypothetical protein FPANT_9366 [Fusarium pseudoanthophilum]